MKFEVIGPDGKCKMSTTYEEYVPYTYMKQMSENGYKFRLDGKIISLSAALNRKKSFIMCVESGELFKTQADAARACGIDPASVSDSIRTGKPRGGLTFVRT